MHCFYCERLDGPGTPAELNERDWKHLFKTLRAAAGEKIMLMDGRGAMAGAVVAPGRQVIIEYCERAAEPEVKLRLYLAAPKKNKMDQLLKQCAEVGVWAITPMLCARSVALASGENAAERWKVLLLEGCKQARNPFLPRIEATISFSEAVNQLNAGPATVFFGAPDAPAAEAAAIEKVGGELAWLVGPEGGFAPEEEQLMLERGFNKLRIGDWVMRVETAAICGAAILLFEKNIKQFAGKV